MFLAINFENGCHYCMGAHSVIADMMSKVPPAVTDALRTGVPLPDARLETLRRMTLTLMATRGRPLVGEVEAFLAPARPGIPGTCLGGGGLSQVKEETDMTATTTQRVDARGINCSLPILRLKKAIQGR